MDRRQPQFHLETHGRNTRVVENATGLIWRTLPDRKDAASWMAEADPPPADRKVKNR